MSVCFCTFRFSPLGPEEGAGLSPEELTAHEAMGEQASVLKEFGSPSLLEGLGFVRSEI